MYLGPLHTKPTVLPTKLNIVKTSNGILCIALIIHVDKWKPCSMKRKHKLKNPPQTKKHVSRIGRHETLEALYITTLQNKT